MKGSEMSNEKESSQLLENLLFPRIFQTFRIAIQPSKLIIALLALAILCSVGWVMDLGKTVVDEDGYFRIDNIPVGLPVAFYMGEFDANDAVIINYLEPGKAADVNELIVPAANSP